MRHIQLFEEFHGPQEVKKVSSTELGDVIDKSMTAKEKPIIIWTESGEMGEPQFQQILSELGVSASFVDLGRSVPKDLETIVGAEVVVGFDLDRAPAEAHRRLLQLSRGYDRPCPGCKLQRRRHRVCSPAWLASRSLHRPFLSPRACFNASRNMMD